MNFRRVQSLIFSYEFLSFVPQRNLLAAVESSSAVLLKVPGRDEQSAQVHRWGLMLSGATDDNFCAFNLRACNLPAFFVLFCMGTETSLFFFRSATIAGCWLLFYGDSSARYNLVELWPLSSSWNPSAHAAMVFNL